MFVWAAILLANPLTLVAVLLSLSVLIDPEYRPGFAGVGLVVGLLAGDLLRNSVWTGFATPRLLERVSLLRTGLILGVIWVVWHGFADLAVNIGQMALDDWLLPLRRLLGGSADRLLSGAHDLGLRDVEVAC